MTEQRIIMGGAPEGFDARLVRREGEKAKGPVIHIARDDKRLAAMRDALAFFMSGMFRSTLPRALWPSGGALFV